MTENKTDRIRALSDDKLMLVVKNYKQYGYDLEVKDTAISILKERGVDEELLLKAASSAGEIYNKAEYYYNLYNRYSIRACVFYFAAILFFIFSPFFISDGVLLAINYLTALVLFVVYIVFLVMSFINQSHFFTEVKAGDGAERIWMFVLLGPMLYFILFFYFRRQMKMYIDW